VSFHFDVVYYFFAYKRVPRVIYPQGLMNERVDHGVDSGI